PRALDFILSLHRPHPTPPPFPYTPLFRSLPAQVAVALRVVAEGAAFPRPALLHLLPGQPGPPPHVGLDQPGLHLHRHAELPADRSEEHTSELQSRRDLVCRLLLEKKKYRQ